MITLLIYKKWLEKQWSDYQITRYTDIVWLLYLIESLVEFICIAIMLSRAGIVI